MFVKYDNEQSIARTLAAVMQQRVTVAVLAFFLDRTTNHDVVCDALIMSNTFSFCVLPLSNSAPHVLMRGRERASASG